jgi:Uma2 family endonuclease
MAFVARHHLTADEYFAMADRLPRFTELIEGEVVVASPSVRHQHIAAEICFALKRWMQAAPGRGQCGIPSDVRIDSRNIYAPDVWWCRQANAPGLDVIRLPELPDLAVEVLSPSTRHYDLGVKRSRYDEQGLPELWIVDPFVHGGVAARVLRRSAPGKPTFDIEIEMGEEGMLASPQLADFEIALADLL